ncbi:hypothetical protein H6G98_03540 [Nostoc sp. FACHB-857]|nr:hypothetical protein [Nostoc sp. FACHB-857]
MNYRFGHWALGIENGERLKLSLLPLTFSPASMPHAPCPMPNSYVNDT